MSRQAGIYVRISSDPTGRALGVARQEKECRAKADTLGWSIAEVFQDNDVSAYTGKPRPAYERMLAAVRAGRIDAVVVWDLDRLTRRPIEIEHFIDLADSHGVALASVGGDVDLSTDNGRLFARIKGAVARSEIERKSERQRSANQQRRESGRPSAGGRRPFGYSADGMELLEIEANAIRRAAADLLAGASIRGIARQWNEAGLLTSAGNAWKSTEVRRVLRNPRYAALLVHKGDVIGSGTWPAVLDEDTHYAVLGVLSDPERFKAGPPRRYLLSGIAKCAVCGEPMIGAYEKRKQYSVYRCSSRKHVGGVRVDDIDLHVEGEILARLARPDAIDLFARPGDIDAAGELRSERSALAARLDGLASAFAEGAITASQLRTGTARIRARLTEVEDQLASLARIPDVSDLFSTEDVVERWLDLDLDKKRAVIRALIEVTIASPGQGARRFKPETVGVTWA